MESPIFNEKVDQLMKIKDRAKFVKELGDVSALLIENNYPWVPETVSKVKKLKDGQVSLTLRVKDKRVVTAVFTEFTKTIYK